MELGYGAWLWSKPANLICVHRIAVWLANAAGRIARLSGRWGGTTLPGKVALKLWPSATSDLAERIANGSVLLSATNGKTTTARLLSRCAEAEGASVCANSAGANLVSGITAALLPLASSEHRCDYGIFEVDEAALPDVAERISPQLVLLMNLFRDQLDRHGELELIAKRWHELGCRAQLWRRTAGQCRRSCLSRLSRGATGNYVLRNQRSRSQQGQAPPRRRCDPLPTLPRGALL